VFDLCAPPAATWGVPEAGLATSHTYMLDMTLGDRTFLPGTHCM
jgi:hypothetical protein